MSGQRTRSSQGQHTGAGGAARARVSTDHTGVDPAAGGLDCSADPIHSDLFQFLEPSVNCTQPQPLPSWLFRGHREPPGSDGPRGSIEISEMPALVGWIDLIPVPDVVVTRDPVRGGG